MKIKLLSLNLAFILFLLGLFFTLDENLPTGAILILVSSAILVGTYLFQLVQFFRQSKFWKWQTLAYSVTLFALAIIFMHGFSSAMGMMMAFMDKSFTNLYLTVGFLLPILFFYLSTKNSQEEDKKWLILGTLIGAFLGLSGFLGFIRIFPFPPKLITYSWIFVLFFYLVFFTKKYLSSQEKEVKSESFRLLLISGIFLGFWIFRFVIPLPMENGLSKAIFHFAFLPLLILPISIISVRKFYSYIVFLCYFIVLDFYFIQFDYNFNYLVNVGLKGCVGYNQATDYPINTDAGMPLEELMKEPSQEELDEILLEWKKEDFSPKNVKIVYQEKMFNGDSIKVISHLVNGSKHYGAIHIPKNLDIAKAPILLELEGGGTGLDISRLRPFTHGKCREQRNKFISILPSYRGCIVRGKNFCFRSEGYCGDAWIGPAEDAVAFLEAVKYLYKKPKNTRVLANGVSRGATVALIIGSLTDKLDYIIATSTHTKFLDKYVIQNERVGQSYAPAFYTPADSPKEIRKRIIASSPYYFAKNLPAFELHQGAKDDLTTVWHANILKKRLEEISKDNNTYKLFIYEDKGHGYYDEGSMCWALAKFIEK